MIKITQSSQSLQLFKFDGWTNITIVQTYQGDIDNVSLSNRHFFLIFIVACSNVVGMLHVQIYITSYGKECSADRANIKYEKRFCNLLTEIQTFIIVLALINSLKSILYENMISKEFFKIKYCVELCMTSRSF